MKRPIRPVDVLAVALATAVAILASGSIILASQGCAPAAEVVGGAPQSTACEVTEQIDGATVICDNGIRFYVAHDETGGWAGAGCFWWETR